MTATSWSAGSLRQKFCAMLCYLKFSATSFQQAPAIHPSRLMVEFHSQLWAHRISWNVSEKYRITNENDKKKTLSFSCCVTLTMTLSLLAGMLEFVVFVSSLLLLLMRGQRTQKINFFFSSPCHNRPLNNKISSHICRMCLLICANL